MRDLWHAGSLLLLDMAGTVLFVALYVLTGELALAVGCGVTLSVARIGWAFARGHASDAMQWLSLALVAASGGIALLVHDPRIVMLKPSVLYGIAGVVMLKPGWMDTYLPRLAVQTVPDLIRLFGFLWAGLMFATGALNLYVALHHSVLTTATAMAAFAVLSKLALFLIQFTITRATIIRRNARRIARAAAR